MAYKRPTDTAEGGTYVLTVPGSRTLMDIEGFDKGIRNNGVQMLHYAAMLCPVGRISKNDTLNRPHSDNCGCQNGFIYSLQGAVTCVFLSNNKRERQEDVGTILGSNAMVTFPRFYDDDEKKLVIVAPFDRLIFAEPPFQVVHHELIDHNETGSDRLRFPPAAILDVVDNRGIKYAPEAYYIDKGQLCWKPGQSPGIDTDTMRGRLYSVRYLYNPYYYIESLNHETRILPQIVDGKRIMMQAQRSVSVVRENVFRAAEQDPDNKDNQLAQTFSPADGSFNPK